MDRRSFIGAALGRPRLAGGPCAGAAAVARVPPGHSASHVPRAGAGPRGDGAAASGHVGAARVRRGSQPRDRDALRGRATRSPARSSRANSCASGSTSIVAVTVAAVRAAMRPPATIPIIIWGNFDPVAMGFAASLARPGGNVTGVLIAADGTLAAKKLELLKEAVPRARRMGCSARRIPTSCRCSCRSCERVAPALGVDLVVVTVRDRDYRLGPSPRSSPRARHRALRGRRRPTSSSIACRSSTSPSGIACPRSGSGASRSWTAASWRTARASPRGCALIAEYVDRILRGARSGEIPIDQPAKFELTAQHEDGARAIGLDPAASAFLLRVDEVIACSDATTEPLAVALPARRRRNAPCPAAAASRQGRLFRKYLLLILRWSAARCSCPAASASTSRTRSRRPRSATCSSEKAIAAASRIEQYIRQIEQQLAYAALPQLDPGDDELRRIEFLKLLRQVPEVTDIVAARRARARAGAGLAPRHGRDRLGPRSLAASRRSATPSAARRGSARCTSARRPSPT